MPVVMIAAGEPAEIRGRCLAVVADLYAVAGLLECVQVPAASRPRTVTTRTVTTRTVTTRLVTTMSEAAPPVPRNSADVHTLSA
jgi:hypothetical protein